MFLHLQGISKAVIGTLSLALLLSSAACSQNVAAAPSKEASAEPASIQDKWAVVVGVSKFSDNKVTRKSGATNAQNFATFLQTKANFAPDHVKVLLDTDATRAGILTSIGRYLPSVAQPDDLIVVYLSSAGTHSSRDVGGINYLVPSDGVLGELYNTGVALQDLQRILSDRAKSKHILVIADVDHGAGLLKTATPLSRVNRAEERAEMILVSSCGKEQTACDGKEGSIFTKRLIEALQANGADTKFASAFELAVKNVQADAKGLGKTQSPEILSTWKGDLSLSAKPASPSSAP